MFAATCANTAKTLARSFSQMVLNLWLTKIAMEMYAEILTDVKKSGMQCSRKATKILVMASMT